VALGSICSDHMVVYAFAEMKVNAGSQVPRRGRGLMKACFRFQMKGDLMPGRLAPRPSATMAGGSLHR
jgi:hypothetical protein